jgi:RNA polymerase sigma factor (sigma-70 family)
LPPEDEKEEGIEGLLNRIAQGDSAAFWALWEEHKDYLFSICLGQMGGNRDDANDALSGVMLKVYERLPRYALDITNLRAWLARLTVNFCVDIHRERSRRGGERVEDLGEEGESISAASDDRVRRSSKNTAALLRQAVDALSVPLREVFILRFIKNKSYQEIAKQLNVSNVSVRKRIQRARDLIKKEFKGDLTELVESIEEQAAIEQTERADSKLPLIIAPSFERSKDEIQDKSSAIRAVTIREALGVELDIYIAIDSRQSREHARIDSLRRYIHRYPTGWKKRYSLAYLFYAMGQWDESLAEYRRVLKRHSREIQIWIEAGEMLRAMGRQAEAISFYESALSLASQSATRHHLRGLIAACRLSYGEAVQEFERAASLSPSQPTHNRMLGLMQLRLERPLEALVAFEASLRINPQDVVSLISGADAMIMLGRVAEAQHWAARTLSLDPENLVALKRVTDYQCVRGFARSKEARKIRQRVREMIHLGPDIADIQDSLALYHRSRGEWKKATAILYEFTVRHPMKPRGWYYYARQLFRSGKPDIAADAILKAYSLYKDDAATAKSACEILHHAVRLDQLKRMLDEMISRFDGLWSVWATAAQVLIEAFGDKQRAFEFSSHALRLQPDLPDTWFQYGRVLAMSGRHRQAIIAIKEGWGKLSEGAALYQAIRAAAWMAEIYLASGEEERAKAWWGEVLHRAANVMDFDPAFAYYYQGEAFKTMGDSTRAVRAYSKALANNLVYPQRRYAKISINLLRRKSRSTN